MTVHPSRIFQLNHHQERTAPVIYWMSRDQRVKDNWALLHAQERAVALGAPLAVAFTLVPTFLGATIRHYGFMLRGMALVAAELARLNIPLIMLRGNPVEEMCRFVTERPVGLLVTDFDPLRIKRGWREQVAARLPVACVEVDAHNIVPCRVASVKQEFGAHTIRPKIRRLLADFLDDFPPMKIHPFPWPEPVPPFDLGRELAGVTVDRSVGEVSGFLPGELAGREKLDAFLDERLAGYDERRNNPCVDGQSGLSPWLHFGQLSAQRVALEVGRELLCSPSVEAFLDELIIRRELSDNFCHYNDSYDTVSGFPAWGVKNVAEHRHDRREYIYDLASFDRGETHDPLWNGAQRQMVRSGTMHGYLRMYWAKKILEWTGSVAEAMVIAIDLNDRYQLDGRDPNGYAGIAWCMGGVHDRAWGERPVFGKVRYMNYNGCKRKFDVAEYIRRYLPLRPGM